MASLSDGLKLGSGSVSSLIKTANTTANAIATFNDDIAADNYANSAKTDEDFQTYQTYLQGRVTTLQASGTVTDSTKALELNQSIITAQKSNSSANIQRENIQVMAGNATLSDKYNVIVNEFGQAQAIGDDSLAQSLESQAYSVSQSIQYQEQESATANQTLANSSASDEADVAGNLKTSLQQFNNDLEHVGQKGMNTTIAAFVKQISPQLQALGVKLPAGAQPNYFDIVNGVAGAIYNAYGLAASAVAGYDPEEAQTYTNDALNIQQGVTKLPTITGGDMTVQEIQAASANGAELAYNEATSKYEMTTQTGFHGYDQNGQPIPTYSGQVKQTVFLSPQQTTQMKQLGLEFTDTSNGTVGDGIQVQSTGKAGPGGKATPGWLQNILGPNGITNMYATSKGLQFEADSPTGKSYYTLATDSRGLQAVYQSTPNGQSVMVGGDYGFNSQVNTLVSNATVKQLQTKAQQEANTTMQSQLAKETAVSAALNTVKTTPISKSLPSPTAPSYVAPSSIKAGSTLSQEETEQAQNAVQSLLATKNTGLITTTYNAIKSSAGYGNPYDQFKLGLLTQADSSLTGASTGAVTNGAGVKVTF